MATSFWVSFLQEWCQTGGAENGIKGDMTAISSQFLDSVPRLSYSRAMNRFLKSATQLDQCPHLNQGELAFVGRSNAGKSSLLNALFGRGLAKVSSKPGHTRLMNFFLIGEIYSVVDLPGYGFSSRGAQETQSWQSMIEAYLRGRENLKALILVIDSRRDWGQEEAQLLSWLEAHRQVPVILALTKADKLNQKERSARNKHFKAEAGDWPRHFVSSTKLKGLKELKSDFEKLL